MYHHNGSHTNNALCHTRTCRTSDEKCFCVLRQTSGRGDKPGIVLTLEASSWRLESTSTSTFETNLHSVIHQVLLAETVWGVWV